MTVTAADQNTQKTELSEERADILAELAHARFFLRFTARDLDDDQARQQTTVSALTIGGLIKHVTDTERSWVDFVERGPEAMQKNGKDFAEWGEEEYAERDLSFALQPGETLAGVLADYEEVARRTDELIRTIPSLDARQPLPKAPWSTETSQTARRTFLHIIAETTQHAGHADIIRESLDGQKSMG